MMCKALWETSTRMQGKDKNMQTVREKIIEQENRDQKSTYS